MVNVFNLDELNGHEYALHKGMWCTGKRTWLFSRETIDLSQIEERRIYFIDVMFSSIVIFREDNVFFAVDMNDYAGSMDNHITMKILLETSNIPMKEIFEFVLL